MQLNAITFDTTAAKNTQCQKVLLQFKETSLCFECLSRVRRLFSFFEKYSETFFAI